MSIPQIEFDVLESEPTAAPKEPKPGEKSKKGRGRRSNASIEAEIRDQLQAFMQLAALFWGTRDDICAGVLGQQAPLIAEDLAALAMKSEWARKYLTRTADMGRVIPLLMHITPVLQAVRMHHITSRFENGGDDAAGTSPVV
ncbi:hypothetical protein [Streptomyces sp. A1-5]|uniref:hypothetical protein n=1 Tax=Streptomyces sp. A1-5 TaxID=2738410 RepID=UPI001F3F2DAE|nr:hypothetical protein [Streptomyces sp. A1-5]UJB45734.1 hypothetical protein HRD51_37600 [Streptomyces sp. A1-5]